MKSINVVIPMAGLGSRFADAGYSKPKPFIDVNGKPMIVRVLENLNIPNANYILIGRKENLLKEAELVRQIKEEFNVEFIGIDNLTEGTACTILFARKLINNDSPLLIANSDQIVDFDINDFVEDNFKRNLHGSILVFKDLTKNPKWSFAKLDSNKNVIEVKEKVAISDLATVGIYLFSQGTDYVDNAIDMIINNDRVNMEFYTCPVYNYLISNQGKIGVFEISMGQMNGIGTPEDLREYLRCQGIN
jgi:dTDP-glucose pyrophosphorylase